MQVEGEVVRNSRNFTKPPQVLFLGSVQVDRQDKERSHSWQYIATKVNESGCVTSMPVSVKWLVAQEV